MIHLKEQQKKVKYFNLDLIVPALGQVSGGRFGR